MKNRILIFLTIIFGFLPVVVFAQNISITQIDPAGLLPFSKIDCYVSITDASGEPVVTSDKSLFKAEHEKENGMLPVKISSITKNGASDEKITFLLVLDNSGSMYKPVGKGIEGTRMDHAKKAVRDFLGDLENTGTRVGLAVFNTRYSVLLEPSSNIQPVIEALRKIKRPDKKDAFTELYYAIDRSAFYMSRYRGRKAIILLSDGQNYSYYKKTGKPNPETGKKLYAPEDALRSVRKAGVTLYGINFSWQKDSSFSSIAVSSGGTIYDALNSAQLLNVYQRIQNRIAKEYRLTLKVPLVFLETPKVRIWYGKNSDTKTYNAPSLMGLPIKKPFLFSLIVFILAIIVWILLVLIHFEKPAKHAEITMLKHGAGKPVQKTIVLDSPKTVIGSSPNAAFTVVGNPKIKQSHAEIIQDKKSGEFTIVSDEEIKVNNRPTKRRKLNPGDVINVEGTTIIFDEPEK